MGRAFTLDVAVSPRVIYWWRRIERVHIVYEGAGTLFHPACNLPRISPPLPVPSTVGRLPSFDLGSSPPILRPTAMRLSHATSNCTLSSLSAFRKALSTS